MNQFSQVGDFCLNKECPDYGKVQDKPKQANIIQFGQTKGGKQRYQCKRCGQTFTETKGTIFYRRRTPAKEITETLALLAEGNEISGLSRAKGYKKDTILAWLAAAGEHAEGMEEMLLKDYQLARGQLDGLWSYVGHKGEKKAMSRRLNKANSGGQR